LLRKRYFHFLVWNARLLLYSGGHSLLISVKLALQLHLPLVRRGYCSLGFRRFFLSKGLRRRIHYSLILVVNVEMRGKESLLLVSFMDEIVDGCDLVVLVIIYALLCKVRFVSELL
jgi:hypothetical protein